MVWFIQRLQYVARADAQAQDLAAARHDLGLWRLAVSGPPDFRFESRPCKNVLSDGGAEVETKRSTPRAQARIASINGLVPITAITRFIL